MCPHVLMGPILVSVISACWGIHPIMPLCLTSVYSVASLPLQSAILLQKWPLIMQLFCLIRTSSLPLTVFPLAVVL